MKVVLFCGGMGTRISDYSENIPKPMVPVGHHPIIWHVMQYYSGYGHQDFILTLGHKANVIKDFFLSHKPETFADCVISGFGSEAAKGLAGHADRYRHLAECQPAPFGRARSCHQ